MILHPHRYGTSEQVLNSSACRETHIEQVFLGDDTMTVTWRWPSQSMLLSSPPRRKPDYVWREVFSIKGGVFTYLGCQEGKHTPEFMTPESFTFEDAIIPPTQ